MSELKSSSSDELPGGGRPLEWDGENEEKGEEKGAGFLDHVEELRWVLIKSVIALTLGMVLVFFLLTQITSVLNAPLYKYVGTENLPGGKLVTTTPMGIFTLILQVGFLGGLGLAMPFIVYFVARFVAPGLTEREKRLMLPICVATVLLFLGGVALGYFVILPGFLSMASMLHEMMGVAMFWSADRYYSLLTWLLIGLGFAFQFPLVLVTLIFLDIVETVKLRQYRRHMIVAFFIIGMIISPTWDPITQSMIALPMWILYEITIKVGQKIERQRAEREKEIFDDV